MEPKEQEAALDVVDRKIERLRTSYEQYFLGMERVVPADLRKDVDRSLRTLRTEHLRNTATKFRFQMLVQRYVTYSTYWDRITRQIEEGTYKRELDRLRRREQGRPAARAGEVDLDLDVELDLGAADADDMDAAIERAIREAEEAERLSLIDGPVLGLDSPLPPPPRVAGASPASFPTAAAKKASVFTDDDLDALDSAFEGLQLRDTVRPPPAAPESPPPPAERPGDTTARKPSARFARPRELEASGANPLAAPRPPSSVTHLLDDDDEGAPTPIVEPRPPAVAPPPPPSPAPAAPPPRAVRTFSPLASGVRSTPSAVPAPPAASVIPARSPAASVVPAQPPAASVVPARPPAASVVPAPPRSALPSRSPGASVLPAASAPVSPNASASRPVVPSRSVQAPPSRAAATGSPPTAAPAARAEPPAASKPGSGVDDEVRRVYQRYVEARRQCNEPTHNVRIESLAKNLDELRKKHGGREIDFEVVIKDGRAAIKPVRR